MPDLLGLRVCSTTIARRVHAHLPRIDRSALLGHLPTNAFLATSTALPSLGLLADAATAAFAIPELRARTLDAHRARHAVVHAAGPSACSRDLSSLLGVGMRAIQTLRAEPANAAVVHAVSLQARLRELLTAERT